MAIFIMIEKCYFIVISFPILAVGHPKISTFLFLYLFIMIDVTQYQDIKRKNQSKDFLIK